MSGDDKAVARPTKLANRPNIRVQSYPNPKVTKCLQNGKCPYTDSPQQSAAHSQDRKQSNKKTSRGSIQVWVSLSLRLWWIDLTYGRFADINGGQ
jgi:hypothetical protein